MGTEFSVVNKALVDLRCRPLQFAESILFVVTQTKMFLIMQNHSVLVGLSDLKIKMEKHGEDFAMGCLQLMTELHKREAIENIH